MDCDVQTTWVYAEGLAAGDVLLHHHHHQQGLAAYPQRMHCLLDITEDITKTE